MGFLRHKDGSSITLDRPIDDVFNAIIQAGSHVGKVKEQSKLAGYVVVRTSMKLFPPKNPATIRIAVKKLQDTQTEVTFSSDSFDGVIGFGSAGKAIDQIINALETVLLMQEQASVELKSLHQLKEDGSISTQDFNAKVAEIQRALTPKPKSAWGLLWKIPLGIVGFLGAMGVIVAVGSASEELKCDSADTKSALGGAFNQSQFAKTLNLSVIEITGISEKTRDAKTGVLTCQASITMNNTKKVPVSYKLEPRTNGHFMLTFEVTGDEETVSANLGITTPDDQPQAAEPQTTEQPLNPAVEACVDNRAKEYKRVQGEEAPVSNAMLDEWGAECEKSQSQ